MKTIKKIKLLIGDNEAGESSIMLALDLVLGGSRSKVETIWLIKNVNVIL